MKVTFIVIAYFAAIAYCTSKSNSKNNNKHENSSKYIQVQKKIIYLHLRIDGIKSGIKMNMKIMIKRKRLKVYTLKENKF